MSLINSEISSCNFLKIIEKEISDVSLDDKFLAIDTEFIRENLEKPLLCLVQISTANEVFIIDPLAIDISFLKPIFEDKNLLKVFHSARQDIEILSNYGINLENFYDTQLYEMILDTKVNISYQSIVLRYLGKKIKKHYSMSNWKNRPLSKKQIRYCEEDVCYLRDVYKKQIQKLTEFSRLHWLDDELQQLKKKDDDDSKCTNAPSFINENNVLIFNQLMEWREKKANEKAISPELIVSEDIIKAICKKGLNFVCSMKNSRVKKNENIREFLFFAEKISAGIEPDEKQTEKNVSINLLKTLLEICSQKNKVAPTFIATTSDLMELLEGNKNLRCLSGWRNDIFGKDALALLNGDLSFHIKDSNVVIQQTNQMKK